MKSFKTFAEEKKANSILQQIKKNLFKEADERSWKDFVDHQEIGDCQDIVASIKRMNIPGIISVFGEIQIIETRKIMTHHWIKYNGKILEFSKGTLKEFVDWDDLYEIEQEDDKVKYKNEIKFL